MVDGFRFPVSLLVRRVGKQYGFRTSAACRVRTNQVEHTAIHSFIHRRFYRRGVFRRQEQTRQTSLLLCSFFIEAKSFASFDWFKKINQTWLLHLLSRIWLLLTPSPVCAH